jgi:hypothetical protein
MTSGGLVLNGGWEKARLPAKLLEISLKRLAKACEKHFREAPISSQRLPWPTSDSLRPRVALRLSFTRLDKGARLPLVLRSSRALDPRRLDRGAHVQLIARLLSTTTIQRTTH